MTLTWVFGRSCAAAAVGKRGAQAEAQCNAVGHGILPFCCVIVPFSRRAATWRVGIAPLPAARRGRQRRNDAGLTNAGQVVPRMAHNSPAQPRTWTPARGAFGPSAAHAYHAPRIGLRHPMERTGMSRRRERTRGSRPSIGRRTRRSAELYARARKVIPAGLTHDSRTLLPYPIYAAAGVRPRKWDVDGNEYVDYFGGHGALLLGHGHPAVVEAIERQVKLGSIGSALARAGGAMGRAGQSPDPLRRARALHCARAPRPRIWRCGSPAPLRPSRRSIRFVGHFHGWHDGVAGGRHVALRGRSAGGHSGRPRRADRPAAGRRRRPRRRHARGARRRGRRHPRAVGCFMGPGAASRGLSSPNCASSRASTA